MKAMRSSLILGGFEEEQVQLDEGITHEVIHAGYVMLKSEQTEA